MPPLLKGIHLSSLILFVGLLMAGIFFSVLIPPVHGVQVINGLNSPFLDFVFAGITNLGEGWILLIAIIALLFHRFYLAIALAANGVMQCIIVSLFKRILFPKAPRPIQFLDSELVHFVQGVSVHKWMSFPSGHTVTIFGVCMFLALCYRNRITSVVLLLIASLVALSRVYLLQHFIVDITAGAIMGSIIGLTSYLIFEKMMKPKWMHQRIELRLKRTTANSGSLGQ